MARAPAPVVEEEVAAADDAAMVAGAEEMAAEEPVVVATILKAADGSLILESGDEPEAVEGAEIVEGAPTGETFTADEDGIGRLMVAVLNLVDPENPEGEQAKANFQEGFGGGPAPAEPVTVP